MATQFEIECALMAGVADTTRIYGVNKFPAPLGYESFTPMPTNSSGLKAKSFIKGNEIVIAFACTAYNSPSDWLTDFQLGVGTAALQLLQAAEYYMRE